MEECGAAGLVTGCLVFDFQVIRVQDQGGRVWRRAEGRRGEERGGEGGKGEGRDELANQWRRG